MVKKLLQQRRRTGEIDARHAYSGRKPLIVQAHENQMRVLLGQKPGDVVIMDNLSPHKSAETAQDAINWFASCGYSFIFNSL